MFVRNLIRILFIRDFRENIFDIFSKSQGDGEHFCATRKKCTTPRQNILTLVIVTKCVSRWKLWASEQIMGILNNILELTSFNGRLFITTYADTDIPLSSTYPSSL